MIKFGHLGTDDVQHAASFYSLVLGWSFDPQTGHFLEGGMPVASAQEEQGHPPSWMPSMAVFSVDAAHQACMSNGGSALMPPATGQDGVRFAVLQDPQGAIFGVHESPPPSPAP
jgi:predicted enzyme related to lactoylglutathione lyase